MINNLIIPANLRNKGLGTSVLKNTEHIMKKENKLLYQLKLTAHDHNEGLIYFFEKNGYRVAHDKQFGYFDDGYTIYSLIPMVKIL